LRNLGTGALWEHSFRSELKLDDLPVEKQSMAFLYADADACYFMNPANYEQVAVPAALVGTQARFLQPEMRLAVEFVEGVPVSVLFPDIIEARIAETAPPVHAQQDSTWKEARLENDVEIMVPQFIKTGDVIRLDVQNLKYVDRAKSGAK
jgi:elongation factor P